MDSHTTINTPKVEHDPDLDYDLDDVLSDLDVQNRCIDNNIEFDLNKPKDDKDYRVVYVMRPGNSVE